MTVDGSAQTVVYQSYSDGLTRKIASEPVAFLDPASPGLSWTVDGYSAATYTPPTPNLARVHAVTKAATTSPGTSLTIATPPGCKSGDWMLLCVAVKFADQVTIDHPGWMTLQNYSNGFTTLHLKYQAFDASWPANLTITTSNSRNMSAILVAIENADPWPVRWTQNSAGMTYYAGYRPRPIDSTSITDDQMNLQVIVGDREPFYFGSIGLPSFVDVATVSCDVDSDWTGHQMAVVVRHGRAPELDTTVEASYGNYSFFVQGAVSLQGAP